MSTAPLTAFFYSGYSLGPAGTIAAVVVLAARLGLMFWRRRRRP